MLFLSALRVLIYSTNIHEPLQAVLTCGFVIMQDGKLKAFIHKGFHTNVLKPSLLLSISICFY